MGFHGWPDPGSQMTIYRDRKSVTEAVTIRDSVIRGTTVRDQRHQTSNRTVNLTPPAVQFPKIGRSKINQSREDTTVEDFLFND